MVEADILGLFIATWAFQIPIYINIGQIKRNLTCPVCKKAIAKKELKEAVAGVG